MLGLPSVLLCGRRDERAYDALVKYGIRPHRLYPPRDAELPPRGCYSAHLMALKFARQHNWFPCLIFEDNVDPTNDLDLSSLSASIKYALQLNPSIVHLSRFPFGDANTVVGMGAHHRTSHDHVIELHPKSLNGLCAYVATTETLALWPRWRDRAIDTEMEDWPRRMAIVPMPFTRAGLTTTNKWTVGGWMNGRPVKLPAWIYPIIPNYCRGAQYLDIWEGRVFTAMLIAVLGSAVMLHYRRKR